MNGDGRDDIIAGSGPGGGPAVRVFDGATGNPIGQQFFAYDQAFPGGVFVASGDVNGDGYDDVITGPVSNGGPHVRVFDGKKIANGETDTQIAEIFAYDKLMKAGVRVGVADVNADGMDEIITAPGPGYSSHVQVVQVWSVDGDAPQQIHSFLAYPPDFTGGVFVGGNGTSGGIEWESVQPGEALTINLSGAIPGNGSVTQWEIDWGDGQVEPIQGNPATATHTYASSLATYTVQRIATNGATANYYLAPVQVTVTSHYVGDFDGDGREDVARRSPSGQWEVAIAAGTRFKPLAAWGTWGALDLWGEVLIGDFNGDGRDDIAGYDTATGQWRVESSTGSAFQTINWATWDSQVNWTDLRAADLNGDGRQEILGRNSGTGEWRVAVSTGTSASSADWGAWQTGITWSDVRVGDFDGDGREDVTGRSAATGEWLLSASAGTDFVHRTWGSWDTQATWSDVLVGDFNGDGLADLAGSNTGQWYVSLSGAAGFSSGNWMAAGPDWAGARVIDMNRDGLDDLVVQNASGDWLVALSSGAAFTSQTWETASQDPWLEPLSLGVQVVDYHRRLDSALEAFEFVRNSIDFQLYKGSTKGAQATRETKAGDAWDEAALLVEMLRTAGVEARSWSAGSVSPALNLRS